LNGLKGGTAFTKLQQNPSLGVKKPVSRKLRRKISRQKEAVRRWLRKTNAVTVVLDEVSDFDKEWCDECFVRNCAAHMRDMQTYPL
jgi:hypothetical protein